MYLFFTRVSFMILIIAGCGKKQNGFVIKGEVTGFEDSTKVYLSDSDSQKKLTPPLWLTGTLNLKENLSLQEDCRSCHNTSKENARLSIRSGEITL